MVKNQSYSVGFHHIMSYSQADLAWRCQFDFQISNRPSENVMHVMCNSDSLDIFLKYFRSDCCETDAIVQNILSFMAMLSDGTDYLKKLKNGFVIHQVKEFVWYFRT